MTDAARFLQPDTIIEPLVDSLYAWCTDHEIKPDRLLGRRDWHW